ncbi:MAG: hypothetical protein AB7F36_16470 [Reyranellaceae bacterium]
MQSHPDVIAAYLGG